MELFLVLVNTIMFLSAGDSILYVS